MKPKTLNKPGVGSTGGRTKPSVSAKSKAVSLLARREHSQSELRSKLLQRGYEAPEVEEAIRWSTEHQFQSDDRFKLSLFRRRASTFGDRAISAELGQHGLGNLRDAISGDNAPEVSVSEEERAFEWIFRRQHSALAKVFDPSGENDPEQLIALKSRVYKALSSRGFEFANIERAWRRIVAEFKSNT